MKTRQIRFFFHYIYLRTILFSQLVIMKQQIKGEGAQQSQGLLLWIHFSKYLMTLNSFTVKQQIVCFNEKKNKRPNVEGRGRSL